MNNTKNKVGYFKGASVFISESIIFTFLSLFLLLVVPPLGLLVCWGLSMWHCIILKRRYIQGDINKPTDKEWLVALWGVFLGPLGAGLVYGHYAGKDLNKK